MNSRNNSPWPREVSTSAHRRLHLRRSSLVSYSSRGAGSGRGRRAGTTARRPGREPKIAGAQRARPPPRREAHIPDSALTSDTVRVTTTRTPDTQVLVLRLLHQLIFERLPSHRECFELVKAQQLRAVAVDFIKDLLDSSPGEGDIEG